MRGAAAHGRWSPSDEFEVLYTSLMREGALAEIGYRLSLQPVWPSRIEHEIHSIDVQTERNLRFAMTTSLIPFGVDAARYRSFDYRRPRPSPPQPISSGFDGLIVPNARFACSNLVIFTERAPNLVLPKRPASIGRPGGVPADPAGHTKSHNRIVILCNYGISWASVDREGRMGCCNSLQISAETAAAGGAPGAPGSEAVPARGNRVIRRDGRADRRTKRRSPRKCCSKARRRR